MPFKCPRCRCAALACACVIPYATAFLCEPVERLSRMHVDVRSTVVRDESRPVGAEGHEEGGQADFTGTIIGGPSTASSSEGSLSVLWGFDSGDTVRSRLFQRSHLYQDVALPPLPAPTGPTRQRG